MPNLIRTSGGRRLLFSVLYAAEGGPIGFLWWALPTLLRLRGAPVEEITGLLALLVLPWTFKFLWAPLVDTLRSPRFGFRAWIAGAQVAMGLTLVPLLWLDPATHFDLVRILLVAHALAAATQDVSIDALAIRVVPERERGLVNGAMQAGMLGGRSLFGGGALILAASLGWNAIFIGLLALIAGSLFLLLFVDESDLGGPRMTDNGGAAGFTRLLGGAFRDRNTWFGILFALVSAAGFEATGALAGPYLVDRGATQNAVGFFLAVPAIVGMLAGGFAGGWSSDRFGRPATLVASTLLFSGMIAGLGFAEIALDQAPPLLLSYGFLCGMYLGLGMFVAASYALFMDLTRTGLGATQFSTFMAATNGCEAWATFAGGRLAAGAGYAGAFLVMSAVSVISLPLLRCFRKRPASPEHEAAP